MSLQTSFGESPNKPDVWAQDALEDAQDSQNAWMTEKTYYVSCAPSTPTMPYPVLTSLSIYETPSHPTDNIPEASTPSCPQDDQETEPLNTAALDIFESSLSTPFPDDDFGAFQNAPFDPFAQPIFATHSTDDSNDSTESLLPATPGETPEPLIFIGISFVRAAYARFDASTRALRRTGKSRKGRLVAQMGRKVDEDEGGLLGVLLDEVEEVEAWKERGVVVPVSFGRVDGVKAQGEDTQMGDERTEEEGVWST
jgi:hypothetical protein